MFPLLVLRHQIFSIRIIEHLNLRNVALSVLIQGIIHIRMPQHVHLSTHKQRCCNKLAFQFLTPQSGGRSPDAFTPSNR